MPDDVRKVLREAREEHERAREALGDSVRPAAGLPRSTDATPGGDPAGELGELEGRLVWIFGSPRSGSSWVMRLLGSRREIALINESYFPAHLVPIGGEVEAGEYYEHGERAADPSYFFARDYMPVLRPLLRELALRGFLNQLHQMGHEPIPKWVAIKEPNGSHAADTVVSLLPGSRVLFLLRDGRDVIDSLLDAMLSSESWWTERTRSLGRPPQERLAFVSQHANLWVRRTMATQRAFDMLPEEQRLLVRYEDLLTDTSAQLRRIFDWLGLRVEGRAVQEVVKRHAFKSVPDDRRGPGKDMRAATPGLWRENLTQEEQRTMLEIIGPKLAELGYDGG
jgi:Sulfotransferase family